MNISGKRNHGNEERRHWRQQCRNRLALHLLQELGITVQPNEIRLKPKFDDPYRWHLSSSKAKLFERQLSKQNITDCKDIFHSIGKTIKAIPAGIAGVHNEESPEASSQERRIGCQMDACVRLQTEKQILDQRLRDSEDTVKNLEKQLEQAQLTTEQLQAENWDLQRKLGQVAAASRALRALSEMVSK